MAEIIKAIDIHVPVEEVFDFVANPHNTLKYSPQFSSFTPVGPKERGLGATVEATGRFLRMEIKTRLEIVEFIPNRKIVSNSTEGVKSRSVWEFKPLPGGITEVTFTSDYSLPGSKLGSFLDKMLVQKEVERTTVECLVNLKKLMENRPNLRPIN